MTDRQTQEPTERERLDSLIAKANSVAEPQAPGGTPERRDLPVWMFAALAGLIVGLTAGFLWGRSGREPSRLPPRVAAPATTALVVGDISAISAVDTVDPAAPVPPASAAPTTSAPATTAPTTVAPSTTVAPTTTVASTTTTVSGPTTTEPPPPLAAFLVPQLANRDNFVFFDGSRMLLTGRIASDSDRSTYGALASATFGSAAIDNLRVDPAASEATGFITMPGVCFFDSASTVVRADCAASIQLLAKALDAAPGATATLTGHSDSDSSPARMAELSLLRVASVRDALVSLGIDTDRIRVVVKGADEPLSDPDTDQGKAENRRVDATVEGFLP